MLDVSRDNFSGEIIKREAGIDWLAMTKKLNDHYADLWRLRCQDAWSVGEDHEEEIVGECRRINGYLGSYKNGVFVGRSEVGFYAFGDGEDAERLWFAAYSPGQRVTRIDLRVTLWYEELKPGWSTRIVDSRNIYKPGRRGRVASIYGFGSWVGDKTIYVGAASSEERGRIYDKSAQSRDPFFQNAIRWEVQLRREQATYVAEQIWKAGAANMSAVAAQYVYWWFEARGFEPPWRPGSEVSWFSSNKRENVVESKLSWLYRQVRPTCKFLVEKGVDVRTIMSALSLDCQDKPVISGSLEDGGKDV